MKHTLSFGQEPRFWLYQVWASYKSIGPLFFNAAQPGVGRVQVLGSKKFQTEDQEQVFGH